MGFLNKLRSQPLGTRRKMVWGASLMIVAIILLASIFIFKDWSWPETGFSGSEDIQEIVEGSKVASEKFKADYEDYKEVKGDLEAAALDDSAEETVANTGLIKSKNNVEVGLNKWERQGSLGIVYLSIKNFSEQDILLKSFLLYQGLDEIASAREVTVAGNEEIEVEISFPINETSPVTGFEARQVTPLNLEASAADAVTPSEWNYIFRIEDTLPTDTAETEDPTEVIDPVNIEP